MSGLPIQGTARQRYPTLPSQSVSIIDACWPKSNAKIDLYAGIFSAVRLWEIEYYVLAHGQELGEDIRVKALACIDGWNEYFRLFHGGLLDKDNEASAEMESLSLDILALGKRMESIRGSNPFIIYSLTITSILKYL